MTDAKTPAKVQICNVSRASGQTLEGEKKKLLEQNPNYYTFAFDTVFPRSHKAVVYADPKDMTKDEFDKQAKEIYDREVEEASSY